MSALDNLISVARALAPIREHQFVFAGASILPLLLNDPAARQPLPTVDVDVVVTVFSYAVWQNLQGRLRDCKFAVHADDPVGKARHCLFYLGKLEVDIMPVDLPEIGQNRILELGFKYAEPHPLGDDLIVQILSAPCFLAAKLLAFENRGVRQLPVSKDLEDILTLLDGRLKLADEVEGAPPEIRRFVADKMGGLLANNQALDVISDILREPGRERLILKMMRKLTRSG